jgi:dienelactone hydrolase
MTIMRLLPVVLAAALAAFQAGSARAEIRTQPVEYRHGDAALSGYLTYDDSLTGRRPGVLMVHDRAGLTDKAREDAQMIARLGYVVFAADMFGKGVLPKTVPEMQALTRVYDTDRAHMRARAQAGLDALRANAIVDPAKLAVIGYCFGGTVSVELAESGAPLVGVVPVHGSFRNFAPEAAKNIRGRMLILHGGEDTTAPLEEVNKLIGDLRAAKIDWKLELYSGASHAFTSPRNPTEQRADREYKAAVQRFFAEIFGA